MVVARLFVPDGAGAAPPLKPYEPDEAWMPSPSDRDELDQFARQFESRRLSPAEAQEYAATTSLRSFLADVTGRSPRFDPIGRKTQRSKATAEKDLIAIGLFERYSPRPESEPNDSWPGLPIGLITGTYLDKTWQAAIDAGRSPAYVASCRQHVQVMLRHAQRIGALPQVPEPKPIDVPAGRTTILRLDDNWQQVRQIYRDLPDLLQLAFVLGLMCGLRAEDLFGLRWSQYLRDGDPQAGIDFPMLDYSARKTAKLQGVPLPPQAVALLDRFAVRRLIADGYIFASEWSRPEAAQPGRTRQARKRNRVAKQVFARHGCPCAKPWQVLRATCNERYERQRTGLGAWVLGHAMSGVNATSYRSPDRSIYDDMCRTPAPDFESR